MPFVIFWLGDESSVLHDRLCQRKGDGCLLATQAHDLVLVQQNKRDYTQFNSKKSSYKRPQMWVMKFITPSSSMDSFRKQSQCINYDF